MRQAAEAGFTKHAAHAPTRRERWAICTVQQADDGRFYVETNDGAPMFLANLIDAYAGRLARRPS